MTSRTNTPGDKRWVVFGVVGWVDEEDVGAILFLLVVDDQTLRSLCRQQKHLYTNESVT